MECDWTTNVGRFRYQRVREGVLNQVGLTGTPVDKRTVGSFLSPARVTAVEKREATAA